MWTHTIVSLSFFQSHSKETHNHMHLVCHMTPSVGVMPVKYGEHACSAFSDTPVFHSVQVRYLQLANLLKAVENKCSRKNKLFCSNRGYWKNLQIEIKKHSHLLPWSRKSVAWNIFFSISLLLVIIGQKLTLFRGSQNFTVCFQWTALITQMTGEDHHKYYIQT